MIVVVIGYIIVGHYYLTFLYNYAGVCVVSWYPPGQADNEGKEPDSLIPKLLDTAALYKIKVNYIPFKYRLHCNLWNSQPLYIGTIWQLTPKIFDSNIGHLKI